MEALMCERTRQQPTTETVSRLRESASHEAGHVLLCLVTPSADLAFARAATAGRGTSRLLNPMEQQPEVAARIALAGRVAEEVLLGSDPRPVPENDGFLLTWAMEKLGGEPSEEAIRAQLHDDLTRDRELLAAVADLLHDHPDKDVTWPQLVALAADHGRVA